MLTLPREVTGRPEPWWRRAGAVVVALVVTAAYTAQSWLQWQQVQPPSWDLAIFDQLIRAYSELRAPIVPVKGEGFNLLGDHFHPLLVVLAPVYALVPGAFTLLVCQAVLLGASTIPVTRLAGDLWGRVVGVLVGLAYGLSWGLSEAVAAEFHEIALAVPLLAWSLEALVRRRHAAAVAWAAPLVLVKEDLGLTVAAIGLVIMLHGRRRLGALTMAGGLAAFALTVLVLLPALNPDGQWDYLARVTGGSGGASAPADGGASATETLLASWDVKGRTLALILVVSGFLALLSPVALVLAPTLAWRFSGDVPFYWGTTYHYSAVLMPVVFMALLDVAARWRAHSAAPRGRSVRQSLAGVAWVPAVVVAAVLLPGSPLAQARTLLGPGDDDDHSAHRAAALEAVAQVPDGVSVEADIAVLSRLSSRTTTYWMGNDNPAPDYVVYDAVAGGWGSGFPQDVLAETAVRHPGTRWEQVYDEGGLHVLRRVR